MRTHETKIIVEITVDGIRAFYIVSRLFVLTRRQKKNMLKFFYLLLLYIFNFFVCNKKNMSHTGLTQSIKRPSKGYRFYNMQFKFTK